jgi:hypothetical protein
MKQTESLSTAVLFGPGTFGGSRLGQLSREALSAIEATHLQFCNCGSEAFARALKQVASDHGLETELQVHDKIEFSIRARALGFWLGRRDYNAHRLAHHQSASFALWVYRQHDCPEHGPMDGLSLPSNHVFWQTHYPANSWLCRCYVVGASTIAGTWRLGAKRGKVLPADWAQQTVTEGSDWFVNSAFRSQIHPGIEACLDALDAGLHLGL